MDIETYVKLLERQKNERTLAMKEAIEAQHKLHMILEHKQNAFYTLDRKYSAAISHGVELLFAQYPELRRELPTEGTKVDQIRFIADGLKTPNNGLENIIRLMKTIPQLVEAEKMNVELGKACVEYFVALSLLNTRIAEDRKTFFSKEYMDKMDALADEGVMLYFLETPDLPLLYEECDANYILDSFIFNDYMSMKPLLEPFFTMSMPGISMRRKAEDIQAAMCNMLTGYQRTAARNWFALLESEHKKCAEVFEGFWEKAREFKTGLQRSNKIQELFERAIDAEWETRAWEKIDAYYRRMVGKAEQGVVNRNALIHGDYGDDSIDVTARDVIKIVLMWLNMRLIADHFCYIEEMFENRVTMVPYLCTLPTDMAIDIMNAL